MSKSPKRPASRRKPKKPATIELEAEKKVSAAEKESTDMSADSKPDAKAETVSEAKSDAPRRSTPRVGRDANKESTSSEEAEAKAEKAPSKTSDSKSQDKASAPSPRTAEPRLKKSSGVGRVAAGVIGAVIALAGAAGLQYAQVLPSFTQTDTSNLVQTAQLEKTNADLSTRIADLQARLEEVAGARTQPDPDSLAAVIDARIAQAGNSVDPEVAGQLLDAENRIISLETTLGEAQQKLSELSDTAATADGRGSVNGAALAEVTNRLDTLTVQVAELKTATDEQTVDKTAIASLQSQIGSLQSTLSSIAAKTEGLPEDVVGVAAVDEKIEGLKTGLEESLSSIDGKVTDLTASVEQQKAALGAVQEQVSNGADRRAAVALIATQLKTQVDRGEPFTQTLETLKSASGEADAYAALEPFAESGVPTLATLTAQFDDVREAILNATMPKQEMSLGDRLLAGAKSFAKIKPLKGVEGDSPDAIVSRIDAALRDNNPAQAVETWQSLPELGKAASQQWFDALQARMKVDDLLSATVQNFISSTVAN